MSLPVLRPRSPSEIVDAAFQLFRAAPLPFLLATAWVYVPWLVVRMVLGIGTSTALPSVSDLLVTGISVLIVYAIVNGVVTPLARAAYLDEPLGVGAAFASVFWRLPVLVLAGVLRVILTSIGFVLLIVPGVYLIARFFALTQTIMLEDAGLLAAFRRSGALSVRLKRHIVNTLLLVWLLVIVVSVGLAFLASALHSMVLQSVVATAVAIVTYPFFGIAETLLYYDTRIRREGFDVEFLAARGATGPATVGDGSEPG